MNPPHRSERGAKARSRARGRLRAVTRLRGRRIFAGLALAGLVGVLLGVAPVAPAVAAGQPNVEVTITNAAGTPIDVVPSTANFEYQVRASYTCVGDTDCTNMTVSIEKPALDPYYGTEMKEYHGTWTPPFSPAPTATGSWDTGWTVNLGTVRSGDIGTIVFSYFIKRPPSSGGDQVTHELCCSNFFPPGYPIDPEVTVTADNASPVTKSDLATYQSIVPTPSLSVSMQAKVKTDTELPVTVDAVSNCWRRNDYRTFKALYDRLCSDTAAITVKLPAKADYVAGSGGSYDAGAHAVTLTAGPDAWRGLEGGAFKVTFSSADYPTSGVGCSLAESFVASGTVTYLNGDVKTTSPANAARAVTVDNCQPFAKGTFSKTAPRSSYQIPTTTPLTGHYWDVNVYHQGNVPAVATITDTTLDQPGLPVHAIGTTSASTINVTLDDGSTDSVSGTSEYTAPSGRRIVSATVVSGRLAPVNSDPNGTAATRFRVVYHFTVQPGAEPADLTNTASATLTYPDNPELGTFTPTGSPDDYTVELYDVVPFAKASVEKLSNATTYAIPATTTSGNYWYVDTCNQANVQGVATVVDDTLDQAGMPVYQINTNSPATITYELDDGTTVTVTGKTTTNAVPTGRRIVKATVTSEALAPGNTVSTGTGCTRFRVYYYFRVEATATPGDRINTASATMEFPNTDLGTITPTGSPDNHTVSLYSPATPYTINASSLTWENITNGAFPPRAGDEVMWKANGQFCNLATDRTMTPQYVFLAPKDWDILAGGASLASDPGATFDYTTITYNGVAYDAVVVTWPTPVAGVGTTTGSNCVTLRQLSVRTTPTLSAVVGAQSGRFFVADAAEAPAEMYSGNVSETATASDIDGDGNTTDTFASSTAAATLTGVPGLLPLKEICQPDDTRPDGCNWLSDPAVTVGVPPDAGSIKYRVTIKNTGQTNLSNIVVYDVLPYPGDTGTSDISAAVPRGSTVKEDLVTLATDSPTGMTIDYSTSTNPPRPQVYSGATTGDWTAPMAGASAIRATIPTLNAGASRTFTYEAALVGATADQTACNSLAVSADTMVDSEPPRVCATTQEADFGIDVTERLPLQAGRVGVVPFMVTNGGGSQSATATVTISVPAQVDVVDLAPEGWDCTAPAMTGPVDVTCTPVNGDGTTRSLQKDAPESIELQVKPTEDAPAQLCFDAAVEGLMSDPNLENNTAQSCSTALSAKPELFVSKDDGRASVAVGEEFAYTITATNGLVAEPVGGVTVTDTLPDALEFVSATPAPTSQSGQTLTWDLGQLGQAAVPGDGSGDQASGAAGSSKSVTVTVRVKAGTQDSITNVAEATGADPADSSITLSADDDDVDSVTNVFTDLGAAELTPQNTPVTTPLAAIVSTTGAPLDPGLVTQATAPASGSLTIDPTTGAVTYNPAPGFSGADAYGVQVCDTTSPTAQCFVATVSVQVGVNVVTAVDDTDATDAATPVTTSVRGNDTTESGQPLAVPMVTVEPGHGAAAVNGDGTITYTPGPGWSGTDAYTYRVCDTSHPDPVCDTATVTLTVSNVFTDGPAAQGNLGVETPHNTPVTTPLADIVTTSGAPVDPATLTQVTEPAHGTLAIDPVTGAVTFTPDAGYAGPDAYTVSMCDTATPDPQCHQVTVAVTVLENTVSAPDLAVETRTNSASAPLEVLAVSVSASEEPLGPPTITTDPAHGTVTVTPDGAVVYTPDEGYDGADSFTYRVCDTSHPTPVCDTGTVTVTVTPVADLAVAKTLQTSQLVAGQPVSWRVTVTNAGPSTATDARSVDPVPAAVADPVGTPGDGVPGAQCVTRATRAADLALLAAAHGPYSLATHPQVVECTYPKVPAGTTVQATITATLDAGLAAGSTVVNQVVVSAATLDPKPENNSSVASAASTAVADLVLTVTTGDRRVETGEEVEVTYSVENRGPSDATGVRVTEDASGLRLLDSKVAARPRGKARAASSWVVGDLASGEQVVRTATYRVTGEERLRVVAVVAATAPADPDLDNNGGDACVSETEGCGVVDFRVASDSAPDPDDGAPDPEDGGPDDTGGGSDGGGGSDQGGGDGGRLPDTGSSLGRGTLHLALALILAGAGALVLGRRRTAP